MSFSIQLMNNTDELNKITKSPGTVMTLQGTLRDEASIVDPVILVEYDGALTGVNYMHIPTFNRYYFINDIVSVRNKLWRIHAHCDVLKTYSEGILGTPAVVARNENTYNLLLDDSMFKVESDPLLQICKFPQKFTGQSYLLIMNGCQYGDV